MADTYSKLLGLAGAPTLPSNTGKGNPAQSPLPQENKAGLLAKKQTSKLVKPRASKDATKPMSQETPAPVSPLRDSPTPLDTSLLTTKEKTKYGTYLTDESIEKISIRAIQVKRDAHQIVQEAVNQYFDRLEK
jgi:hypothetical protein